MAEERAETSSQTPRFAHVPPGRRPDAPLDWFEEYIAKRLEREEDRDYARSLFYHRYKTRIVVVADIPHDRAMLVTHVVGVATGAWPDDNSAPAYSFPTSVLYAGSNAPK